MQRSASHRTAPLAALALALAPSLAAAQQVAFRGKVEDVQGTANQFFLGCTDAALTSGVLDLNAFVGQTVAIEGVWNGSVASPSVDVTSIAPAAETFEIGGGAKLGETSTLAFTAAPGTVALGALSLAASFVPFGPDDTILIDPSQIGLTRVGTVGGSGVLELGFAIPAHPDFLGLEIHGQGALVAGGVVTLTNPDCKTITD